VIVEPGTTATDNGTALLAALDTVNALAGLGADTKGVVLLPPGHYDIGSTALELDTAHTGIVSLSGNPRDTIIETSADLDQTADNIILKGLWLKVGRIDNNAGTHSGTRFEDCIIGESGSDSLAGTQVYSQTFYNCLIYDAGSATNQVSFTKLIHCDITGTDSFFLVAGAIVRGCVIEPELSAGAGATDCKVYNCALKSALNANLSNAIGTPNNVVDSDIAV
jgi:hypothetical protein